MGRSQNSSAVPVALIIMGGLVAIVLLVLAIPLGCCCVIPSMAVVSSTAENAEEAEKKASQASQGPATPTKKPESPITEENKKKTESPTGFPNPNTFDEDIKEAREREAKFRTWNSADGSYTVEAIFIDFKDGKAVLEKRDGSRVEVTSGKLSTADRDFIQEKMKSGF